MSLRVTLLLSLILMFAFGNKAQSVDLILTNSKIHRLDSRNRQAESVAISGNKIVAVGKNTEIRKLIQPNTKVIDAKGKLVLPGFNDSHVHLTGVGNKFSSIDLRFANNPDDIVARIKHYVRFLPKGRWILGGQWDHTRWSPDKLPTKELIDSVTPDNPVFLYNKDATMAWVNSLALKLAEVDRNRKNLKGGEIVRDKFGEPTGILKNNAILFVKFQVPKLATRQWYEVVETATNYAASLGIASVQDVHSDSLSAVLHKLKNDGKLKTRVYDCTPLIKWKELAKAGIKRASGDSMIRTGCLKGMVDSDPESEEVMYRDILAADKAGLQVLIHAIGRSQNKSILNIFERVIKENGEKDRRFRVEHAYGFRRLDLERFARSKIIPSLQPRLFYGNEPYRSLLNSKAQIAFGSDASMTDFNPLAGISAAVNQSDENEALTVEEAVYLYTMGSAYGEFQEHVKGSITVGKLADLVILSDDIFSINKKDIAKAKVLMTIVDGKIVYQEEF